MKKKKVNESYSKSLDCLRRISDLKMPKFAWWLSIQKNEEEEEE